LWNAPTLDGAAWLDDVIPVGLCSKQKSFAASLLIPMKAPNLRTTAALLEACDPRSSAAN